MLVRHLNIIIVITMIVSGIILFWFSYKATKFIGPDCNNAYLRNAWTGVLSLGAVLIVLSLGYGFCIYISKNCVGLDSNSSSTGEVFFSLGSFVSLLLIVVMSLMVSFLAKGKYSTVCGGRQVRLSAITILVLSILAFICFTLGGVMAQGFVPKWISADIDKAVKKGGGKNQGIGVGMFADD